MPLPASLEITCLPSGRQLTFGKELEEGAQVYRRAGGPWLRLARRVRSPYLDTDPVAAGTRLEYYVGHTTRYGDEESRSVVVSVLVN
ncbi:MAG: hypothetical protein NVS3B25_15350 [Hymenobacter sp.]